MNYRDVSEYYERTLSIRYFDVAHRSCTRVGKQVPRFSLIFDYTERFYPKRAMSATRWRPTKTYRTPPTSWSVEYREIQPLFSRWLGKTVLVHNIAYRIPAVLGGGSYLLLRSICRFSPTFFPVGICLVDYRNAAKLCVFLSFALMIQGGQYCLMD